MIAAVICEWRIGWSQGAIMRAVTTLDRIDPGWQRQAKTIQMLGLTERGSCTSMWVSGSASIPSSFSSSFCGLSFGHLGSHKDPATGTSWWFAPETGQPGDAQGGTE